MLLVLIFDPRTAVAVAGRQVRRPARPYRAQQGISATWEARERVAVALTGGPEGETLIRRAARIAAGSKGADFAVHIARSDGLAGAETTPPAPAT